MWIAIAVAAAVILFVIILYNSLVMKRNQVDNAFAAIDTQLKKRYDLIPNLVSSAKAYMKHESDTLTKITEFRARAMDPGLPAAERMRLDNEISGAIRGIMVQMENYPQLRASENIQILMRSLNEVEAQLSASRRTYNASVTEYNNAIQMFPGNLFASSFGFRPRELFSVPEEERANPNVANLFKD